MSNADVDPHPAVISPDLALTRKPPEIIEGARGAAIELQKVISTKKKRVIFNGEQYLEFEDWQLLGRFYNMTVQVKASDFISYGDSKKDEVIQGFWARADVLQFGTVISSAEAMCLNDEPNWSKKPLFQLRSMAQTRACAKALRNVLSYVAVLAGYRPTPAEEMEEMAKSESAAKKRMPQAKSHPSPMVPPIATPMTEPTQEIISKDEQSKFVKICQGAEIPNDIVKTKMLEFGYKNSAEIRRGDFEGLCKWAANFGRFDNVPSDYDDSV
jgi:hypothetical protein